MPKHLYENYYFKAKAGEPAFMSGLPMPPACEGPYTFIDCEFHPRLWDYIKELYSDSTFINCDKD